MSALDGIAAPCCVSHLQSVGRALEVARAAVSARHSILFTDAGYRALTAEADQHFARAAMLVDGPERTRALEAAYRMEVEADDLDMALQRRDPETVRLSAESRRLVLLLEDVQWGRVPACAGCQERELLRQNEALLGRPLTLAEWQEQRALVAPLAAALAAGLGG